MLPEDIKLGIERIKMSYSNQMIVFCDPTSPHFTCYSTKLTYNRHTNGLLTTSNCMVMCGLCVSTINDRTLEKNYRI